MSLIWKLLRCHISVPQFVGFLFANLFGMLVVLLSIQFYLDIQPVFSAEDSFLKDNFLVVSKRINAAGSLSGQSNTLSKSEIDDIQNQPFCKSIGTFCSSTYKVSAAMGVNGAESFTTDLFFEAVPDEYVETEKDEWVYTLGEKEIPIILPRTYLALYNFGFARSRGLPTVSEGLTGLINMKIFIHGNGKSDTYRGKIIGFSSRLNTILVPLSFLQWSNGYYTPNQKEEPSRVILAVYNPTDEAINKYMDSHGYEVEDDKLEAGKVTYFLKIVLSLVMFVGLLISVLSFYILMLSIYLLVQKNAEKLENLLLIGYSPTRVSFPYQALTFSMNALVLVLALVLLVLARSYYMGLIELIFPQVENGGIAPAVMTGCGLFVLVSIVNVLAIRHKIMSIWYRKSI